jgi:hypothetical protein
VPDVEALPAAGDAAGWAAGWAVLLAGGGPPGASARLQANEVIADAASAAKTNAREVLCIVNGSKWIPMRAAGGSAPIAPRPSRIESSCLYSFSCRNVDLLSLLY